LALVKDFPIIAPPGEWFPSGEMLSMFGRELRDNHYAILGAINPVVLVGLLKLRPIFRRTLTNFIKRRENPLPCRMIGGRLAAFR
jgi:hypothetical protein